MFGRKHVGKARLHLFIKVADALRCGQIRLGLPRHGFQEEGAPAVPVPLRGHIAQALHILILVVFKVAADVKVRLGNRPAAPQHQRDQHPAQAAIAVFKRMQRLEFGMRQRRAQQNGHGLVIHQAKQRLHAAGQMLRRHWHKAHLAASAFAHVVLLVFVGSGRFAGPAPKGKQLPVHAFEQRFGQGAPLLHHGLRRIHGPAIEGCFHRVRTQLAQSALVIAMTELGFQQQNFIQRADRALHA